MENLDAIWQQVLNELAKTHNDTEMTLWLAPLKAVGFEENTITLENENEFKQKVVENTYTSDIREALTAVFGFSVEVDYVIAENQSSSEIHNVPEGNEMNFGTKDIRSPNYEFSFDNFIVGPSNNFAYAACSRVAEKPGVVYNPLLIYGRSGLGKTHLLMAIYHRMLSINPNAVVLYTTGESFFNEFLSCLQNKDTEAFHNKYRYIDVLLIDDIHFIAGKTQAQEEFFHTFNALKGANHQIVMTSDRPPKEMEKLEERLRTRFESGLLTDVQPPELETRMAIIRKKAEKEKITIPNNVVLYIAENLKSNIRQLEGIVTSMASYSSALKTPITMEMAQTRINDMVSGTMSIEDQIDLILSSVCEFFVVPINDVKSNSRQATIANARQVCMYIMRDVMRISLNDIGMVFGGKNHSTVNYSINQVIKQMQEDTTYRINVNNIIRNVQESLGR
jgi:chromosomal replication initiator protein